jgi:hypothetical protein
MANYTKSTNFAVKDGLPSGDPQKVVKGTEIDTEFNNIATSIGSKADLSNPQFLGTPFAPTASPGTNTTQIANTAFVNTEIVNERAVAATLTNKTLVTPKVDVINENTSAAGVTVDGVLLKDGNVTGTLTGNVTGNITGNVTGNVTGSAGTVTTLPTAQVLAATVGATLGDVGTLVMAWRVGTDSLPSNGTTAGSTLRVVNTLPGVATVANNTNTFPFSGTSFTGTWRKLGGGLTYAFSPGGDGFVESHAWGCNLYIRIS